MWNAEYLSWVSLVDHENIPPVQRLPDSTQDGAERLSVASPPADNLSYVIRMDVDGEARTLFCRVRLDDYEFGPVNQRADGLG